MSDDLERLVREVREDLGTQEARGIDWDVVDRGLFARIDEAQRAERVLFVPKRTRTWAGVAVGLAAAAALAMAVGKTRERGSLDSVQAVQGEVAGSVVAIEGSGEVLVDGKPTGVGAALRLGNAIEARDARVTVERYGKLMLVLEAHTRATVVHVQGGLVLALDRGAVEAQVVPVASGEAFAVDVGRSRVAVHGTHLRVARVGERVVVDLSEGVVSVGEAPRVGSTFGDLVTAPAHAEFAATDAQGTLSVTHDSLAVRVAVALGPVAQGKPLAASPLISPPSRPETSAEPRTSVSLGAGPHGDSHGSPGVVAPQAAQPAVDPNAEATLATAVRACMAERPHAENITVVVSTTLRLDLSDDGSVRAARFDPPVAPDVNACAVQRIYAVRFTHGGAVSIPIDFKN